jgi:hypothetical protein
MGNAISRRQICTAGMLAFLKIPRLALPPLAAGAALIWPSTARADPVTIAIAVGTAIASKIAAHNQSDGGLRATLQATLEYQRIISKQLLDVQTSLNKILTEIQKLDQVIRVEIRADRIEETTTRVASAADKYSLLVQDSTLFKSYDDWARNSETIHKLRGIEDAVTDAVLTLKNRNWLGPESAIYFPLGLKIALSVRTALGQPSLNRSVAQSYLDYYTLIEDPNRPGSTAYELQELETKYWKMVLDLSDRWTPPKSAQTAITDALLFVAAAHDYVPPQKYQTKTCEVAQSVNPYIIKVIGPGGRGCEWVTHDHTKPGRDGPTEDFGFLVQIDQTILKSGLENTGHIGIRQYSVSPTPLRVVPKSKISMREAKDAKAFQTENFNAPTSEERQSGASSRWNADALRETAKLKSEIGDLNQTMARIAFCYAALAAVSSSRNAIYSAFDKA